jgi:predicted amidohydrolase
MKVGYVQFRPVFGKKEKNLERILNFLREGARKEADLLVLPELCNVGYVFRSEEEVKALSEEVPEGETTKMLADLAKDGNLCVVAGLCERKDGRFYNSSVLVGPDGFIAVYRKAHLFDEEKCWFSKGNTPFEVYSTAGARIGMMICFDWFFPEAIRILALKGAQIVCHPSNLVLPYCQTALLGAAVQNRVFIITANRAGTERGIKFTGMSQIVGPDMKIVAKSRKNGEELQVVEIDPKSADSKKVTGNNDLWADRRIDFYKQLLEPDRKPAA